MIYMKLTIPHFKQAKGSPDCGPACVQMILSYYKVNKTLSEIKESLTVKKTGTSAYQIGLYFLQQGFRATITTQNPYIFSIADREVSQRTMLTRLKKLSSDPVLKKQKEQILHLIAFMRAGGYIKVAVPNHEHIKESIDRKSPLIALCTTQFVTDKRSRFNFHFLVVTGYSAKNIIINDPDGRNVKKDVQRIIDKEDFMYGLHACAAGDADNASLLSISK